METMVGWRLMTAQDNLSAYSLRPNSAPYFLSRMMVRTDSDSDIKFWQPGLCPAHKERRHPGNVFTTSIRNDLERQSIGIGLNTLVYKYEQGKLRVVKTWTQFCEQ
jgi:hypothetical protein